jgi:hypothetical protein
MTDQYFGAVAVPGSVLLADPPQWLVNEISLGGVAVKLATIREPRLLFVVRSGGKYVHVAGNVTTLSSEEATPFRVYRLASGVHYIQVPAGEHDEPTQNGITVFAPGVAPRLSPMDAKNPTSLLGWTRPN